MSDSKLKNVTDEKSLKEVLAQRLEDIRGREIAERLTALRAGAGAYLTYCQERGEMRSNRNSFTSAYEDERVILNGVDLSWFDLSGYNFGMGNLDDAICNGTNFEGATFPDLPPVLIYGDTPPILKDTHLNGSILNRILNIYAASDVNPRNPDLRDRMDLFGHDRENPTAYLADYLPLRTLQEWLRQNGHNNGIHLYKLVEEAIEWLQEEEQWRERRQQRILAADAAAKPAAEPKGPA